MYVGRRAGFEIGKTVAILGLGPIGLLVLQVAKAKGATNIIGSDIYPKRLELASRLGATRIVGASKGNTVDAVMEFTEGKGADIVIEAAGSTVTTQQAIRSASKGRTVVLVGWVNEPEVPIDIQTIGVRELDVKGMFRYSNVYPEAINLLGSGRVDTASLITHSFPLAQVVDAFELASRRKDEVIKAVVEV
ncbi:MAG: zinc-binding dehydrogenase [Firmicutes bacterium]|nr:zinc-binding dehydrogenase [Bacillota bacterium]